MDFAKAACSLLVFCGRIHFSSMAEASGHDISGKVASLAQEVRELKALLTSQGLAKDAINRHAEVLSKVAALQSLKSQLAVGDPCRDEVIHARLQEERLQRQQTEDALAKVGERSLKEKETCLVESYLISQAIPRNT